jgi:hypothetical protein
MSDALSLEGPKSASEQSAAHVDETNPAPAPKAIEPASVPTMNDLSPGQQPAPLAHADNGVLIGAIKERVEAIYAGYERAQENTFQLLAEPPAPRDEGFALQALSLLVEGLATITLGRLGAVVVDGLKSKLGSGTADAARTALNTLSKEGGKWAASEFRSAAVGHARQTSKADPAQAPAHPGAKTLLETFKTQQANSLRAALGEAKIRLLSVQAAVERVNRDDLSKLASALLAFESDDSNFGWFSYQVTTGWMNFCASTSLGPQNAETSMPDANRVGGITPDARVTWAGAHDGFVDISVTVPDEIHGTTGLTLESVFVEASGPGAARVLRDMNVPLMSVPVFRRISLGNAESKVFSATALVITPEGVLEVDDGNEVLASIGKGQSASFDQAWLGRESAELGELTAKKTKTDGETRRIAELWVRRSMRAADAQNGARLLASWLARYSTREVRQ